MRNVVFSLALVSAVVAGSRAAHAASAVGTWKSSSGNTFTIPESQTDFDIITHDTAGHESITKGHWVAGLVGTQFTYATCTATINRKNTDQLQVQCTGQAATTWTRVAGQVARTGGIVGNWHTGNGWRFEIPRYSETNFDVVQTDTKSNKTLLVAKWVTGLVGTQFTMNNGTCTFNIDNADEIHCTAATGPYTMLRDNANAAPH